MPGRRDILRQRRELVPTDCWTPKIGGEGCPPASGKLRLGRKLTILRSPLKEEKQLQRFGKDSLIIKDTEMTFFAKYA
mgnify:CR=1 FL=1